MTDLPPPPPFQPPTSETKSPTPNSAVSARQDELDALRRKGLAKIFNRHFTTVSEKITAEREAADKALAEIISRKTELASNPKSFDKGGLTLTQLDAMHMEYQKRKQTVSRKERETLELYRRYVSQYGGNGSLSSSDKSMNIASLPILHENESADVSQRDLMRSRERNTDICEGVSSPMVRKLENGSFYDKSCIYPSSAPTSVGKLMKKDFASTSTPLKNTLSADEQISSAVETPGEISSMGSFIPGPQDKFGMNNDNSELGHLSPSNSLGNTPSNSLGNTSGLDSSHLGGVMVDGGDDEDSTMSGLTTIDGATVAEAEFKLTEFLREETENIRKMLSTGIGLGFSEDEISTATTRSATSVESRRAIEAATKAEEMAQKMKEETAWMADPSLLESDSDKEEDAGDEEVSETAQPKAEWTAYWSEQHETVYYFNSNTNQTCWTEPRGVLIDKSEVEKRKAHNRKNYEDTDSVVVKDYTKSAPKEEESSTNRAMEENLEMIDQFRPSVDGRSVGSGSISKSSKVLAFKRKQALRRRKKRVRLIIVFTFLGALSIGMYQAREGWMPILGLQTAQQKIAEEKRIQEEANAAAKKAEEERKKVRAEEERKQAEKKADEAERERERERAEEDAKKQKEAEEEVRKKEVEEKARKEEDEARRKAELAEEEARRKAEEEAIKKAALESKKAKEEARQKAELESKKKKRISSKEKSRGRSKIKIKISSKES